MELGQRYKNTYIFTYLERGGPEDFRGNFDCWGL